MTSVRVHDRARRPHASFTRSMENFRKIGTVQLATDVETVGNADTNGFGILDAFQFVLLAK